MVALFSIILTLILVIGLHELGHAFSARYFEVKILRIAIGFGRPLLLWKSKNAVEWVIGMWPLGGYVQLLNTRIAPVSDADIKHCFDKKSPLIRFMILAAGAVMNLIVAFILITLVFLVGLTERSPVVGEVIKQSVAEKAGILPGDKILAVANHPTVSWREVGTQIILVLGKSDIPIVVQSQATPPRVVLVNLQKGSFPLKSKLMVSLGLKPNIHEPFIKIKSSGFVDAISKAFSSMTDTIQHVFILLKQLLAHQIPFSLLLGPIGFLALTSLTFAQGFINFLFFIGGLSITVALVNLFPIPGLDGGSLVYLLLEKIRGKPVSIAWEVLLHRLAYIVFAVLLVNLLVNDLLRMG